MPAPTVAVFCMAGVGHFRRCMGIVEALVGRGADVVVVTDPRFEDEVEAVGARFVDLFAGRPMAAADDETVPNQCRNVSFAGRYADAVVDELRRLEAKLVVADSFAVVGRVAARALRIPCVVVHSGHNVLAQRLPELVASQPHVHISEACLRAVEVLRDRYGIADAHPFMQIAAPSPVFNVVCEPSGFFTAAERERFAPVAFFGSLTAGGMATAAVPGSAFPDAAGWKVYVSFGTIAWRYFAREALAALPVIAAAIAATPGATGLVSLGGADVAPEVVAGIERPGVRVERFVDQRAVLGEADAFVTHHGLNSTHEAVFAEVPMVSYPFWWDQPGMADRCQELDLAVPLAPAPLAPLGEAAVRRAFTRVVADRERLAAGLAAARTWELEAVAGRGAAADRILALVG